MAVGQTEVLTSFKIPDPTGATLWNSYCFKQKNEEPKLVVD